MYLQLLAGRIRRGLVGERRRDAFDKRITPVESRGEGAKEYKNQLQIDIFLTVYPCILCRTKMYARNQSERIVFNVNNV